MTKTLKDFSWDILILERHVGFPNFYWKAMSDDTDIKITRQGPYNSAKSAKENFRVFAKGEEIKKYRYL